jgi:tetratricopeptide (TPR) repeat protein
LRLSALMIVKNEEAIVGSALASVRGFDEIIVVDTGSTDNTIEIARAAGAIVHTDYTWQDDFASARNRAIELATGDWCFSIDADHELLSPPDLVRSEAARAEATGERVALVRSLHVSGGEHWREVLFRRDPSVRWKGAVHECLNVTTTFQSRIERRCGYSGNHALDPERNLRILLKSADTPRTRFYLGREHFERKQFVEAIEAMQKALPVLAWLPEIVEAHITLARCYWQTGEGNKARASAMEAVRNNPDCTEALMLMSVTHHEPWKSKWARLAKAATNEDVLFIRA